MGPSPVPKTAPDGGARELDGNSSYGSLNDSNLLTASNHEEEHGGRDDRTVPDGCADGGIDYLLKTRRIRLSNVSRLLKSARSDEEK